MNSNGTITASYATGDADGGFDQFDKVGGLVGVNGGIITASYATGDADGGDGDSDHVGGLVGWNGGTITASYATGDADGGAGNSDHVGGLVGRNRSGGTITASYATGDADGGDGTGDRVGGLVGWTRSSSIITASYGFGMRTGETLNTDGMPPAGVMAAAGLTLVNAGNADCDDDSTDETDVWSNMVCGTLNAWDFGDATQAPALRYADYDGAGTDYACSMATLPLTDRSELMLICGTTLIPEQPGR